MLLAEIRPLQESPAFRRLWIGQSVSAIGNMITGVVVALQVYDLTHSSLAVGVVGVVEAVPILLLGLLGGRLADTFDRRTLALWTGAAMAFVSGLFVAQAATDVGSIALLYLLAALQAGLSALFMPATRAMLPDLVPRELIPAAVSLWQLSFQSSLLLGPLIAGVLVATKGFGSAYFVDAVSFLVVVYAAARLPRMPRPVVPEGDGGDVSIRGGLRYLRRQPMLSTVLALDLTNMVFGMPMALFPAFAEEHYGGGSVTAGVLYSAPAMGGILAGVLSGPIARVRARGMAYLVSTILWGGGIVAFGLLDVLWLGVFALAVAGAADLAGGIVRGTLIQVETPPHLLGRVNSVAFVNGEVGPGLGHLEAGIVASVLSPAASAVSGGLVCVAAAGVVFVARPAFARYRADDLTTTP
ncbi:MAG: MFS transporter [Angustibacter sp.]